MKRFFFSLLIANLGYSSYEIDWYAFCGGRPISSDSYSLGQTMGEPTGGKIKDKDYTLILGFLSGIERPSYFLSGIIFDVLTKEPVLGARIELDGKSKTIESGSYTISRLSAGTYTLMVTKDGYFPATRTARIQDTGCKIQDVGLCPIARYIPANTWVMFSPPSEPSTETTLSSTNTIKVGKDLGRIDNLKSLEFRTYRWDPTKTEDDEFFAKYIRPGTITPGESYWFKVYGNDAFLKLNSTNSANSTNSITLYPGWNMMANPFSFMVKKPIEADFWAWDETEYKLSDVLLPWKGYFVYSETKTTITVPPTPFDRKDGNLSILSLPKGLLKLSAQAGKYSDQAFIGFGERRISYKPPIPLGEYIRLSIGNSLYKDIRELKDVNTWDISITKNTNEPVTLSWEGDFPEGYDCWLIEGGNAINMRKNSQSEIRNPQLKIKMMKPNSGLIVETLELTNIIAYPNPAKDSAIVRISAKTSNANLRMEVYNILGQKVVSQDLNKAFGKKWAEFSPSEGAYIYEAGYSCRNTFNQPLANGLYFIKVIASENGKETSKIGRMVIKR